MMSPVLEFRPAESAQTPGRIIAFGAMSIRVTLAPKTERLIQEAARLSGEPPANLYAEYAHTLIEEYYPHVRRRYR